MRKSLLALLALAAAPLFAQDAEQWELTSARIEVRLNLELLAGMGVRIAPAARPDGDGYVSYSLGADGRLVAEAPGSIFRMVVGGELRLSGGPVLQSKNVTLTFEGATIRPTGAEPSTYVISAADGSPLFVADHQFVRIDRVARTVRFFDLGLRLTSQLASRLGHPLLADVGIGVLEMNAAAGIPIGSVAQPDGACITPIWGNPHNDVGLTNASGLQQFANAGGIFAAAPSATLKNVGTTDVPWIEMFAPPNPNTNFNLAPYGVAQHPLLVWNMYRVMDGRLDQIGASGAKHAFATANTNCGCDFGATLWVGNGGCEDAYDSGTNNSSSSLGPRTEITAHTGVWQSCGSIFDPNCDGVRDTPPGFTGASDPRRMTVAAVDVTNVTKGTLFYYDAWYVVRDDVNIFNTMAYQRVNPTLSGSTWSFPPVGAQTQGAVVDAWVNPTSPGPNADNKRIDTGEGWITVAVRARTIGGLWRYDYAVVNHSFDRRIKSFTAQVPAGASVTGMTFHDVDRKPATDWVAATSPGSLSWTAPTGAAQDWGLLYSFGFMTDAAPSAAGAAIIRLGIEEAPGGELQVGILGPAVP